MFGMKILKESEWTELREEITRYQRELEDIGWINMTLDAGSQSEVIIGNFKKMIKACRVLYFNNPLAALTVHLTTSFTFGEGVGKPKAKEPKIQEVIDELWDDPDNKKTLSTFQAQQLLCNKLQYEGNIWFVLFTDDMGRVKVRLLNTEEVDDVIMDKDDRMRENFFKVGVYDKSYDFIAGSYKVAALKHVYYPDAEIFDNGDPSVENIARSFGVPLDKIMDARIYHVKINCDINDKYGVPELYRILDWVRAHKSTMEDLATLGRALAQFAWKKKVKGGQAAVNSIAGNLQSRMNLTNIRSSAGQTQVENDGVNLESIDVKTGGTDVMIKTGREMKLMVCAGSGIYEHYTGDPSTGNLATAKSMELPMVKKFRANQRIWMDIFAFIFDYAINQKIEAGLLEGKVEIDQKAARKTYTTTLDRHIDQEFPPILEEDLKVWADALTEAKDNGMVSEETAARLFLNAANVDDIDEELLKIQKDTDRKKAEQVSTLGANPPGTKLGQDGQGTAAMKPAGGDLPGGGAGAGPDVANYMESVAKGTQSAADRIKMRQGRKENYTMQRMNGYRKVLKGHLKALLESARKDAKVYKINDKWTVHVDGYADKVHRFAESMQESARQYFPIAIAIGEKHMQSILKEVKKGFKAEESLYESKGMQSALLQKRLMWNSTYMHDKFMPAIIETMDRTAQGVYESEDAAHQALSESISKFDSRVEQYVGAFWTVEEEAVKEAGRGSGVEVSFGGPDDEVTCESCQEAVANSPYPIDEAPVPGDQECHGRCRHALQVVTEDV